jgi:hypothetical protein
MEDTKEKQENIDNDNSEERSGSDFEYSAEEIHNAIEQVNSSSLSENLKKLLVAALQTVVNINILLQKKNIAISRLKKLFGFKTEKKTPKKRNMIKIKKRIQKNLKAIMKRPKAK